MYYKSINKQDCIDYDNQVTQEENYVENDNWANPIEREGNWYILKHKDYECDLELISELPQIEEIV